MNTKQRFNLPHSSSTTAQSLIQLFDHIRSHAKNLGMIFDDTLKFDEQISTVIKYNFFQLSRI